MEVVAEIKTLSVYMKCDKCNNGLMLENGHIILTTDPPKYPHNGAYQIMKKVVPDAFSEGIEGVGLHPVRFSIS